MKSTRHHHLLALETQRFEIVSAAQINCTTVAITSGHFAMLGFLQGLARWAAQTPEGAKVIAEMRRSFNVAEIVDFTRYPEMVSFFAEAGISNVEIIPVSADDDAAMDASQYGGILSTYKDTLLEAIAS